MSSLTWARALAWRMRRQFLEPVGDTSVEAVVQRLGAVRAQAHFGYELSVNLRRSAGASGDVAAALADGRLLKTFAFRGGTYLMTPGEAGIYLALRASSRMWELPSWQSYYGLKPADWPAFRATVREALAAGPLTRSELGAAVTRHARYRQLAPSLDGDNWTLLKPLAWLGDMCFGPSADGRATFQRPDANPRWQAVPDSEDAGPRAVEAYFAAYGPATHDHVNYWLGAGLGARRKRVTAWIAQLGDKLAEVDVEGERLFVLREHLDELLQATQTHVVRLLPAFDQWVMGPGTADEHVTPRAQRPAVTRGANVVIAGGVVSGVWTLRENRVTVDWLPETRKQPREALALEVGRLGRIIHRELDLE